MSRRRCRVMSEPPLFAVGPCASTKSILPARFLEEPNSGWVTCRRPCPCDHSSDCQRTTWCETKWDRRDTAISLINEFPQNTEGRRHYSCNRQLLCCERWEDWENVAVHYSGHSFCFRSPHYQRSKLWLLNSTHEKKDKERRYKLVQSARTSSKMKSTNYRWFSLFSRVDVATHGPVPFRSPFADDKHRQAPAKNQKQKEWDGRPPPKPGNTQPESGPGDSRPSSSPWMFRVAQYTKMID